MARSVIGWPAGPVVIARAGPPADAAHSLYVNGRLVVDGGRVLAADEAKILDALQAAGERMWPRMAARDRAGRGADQRSPQTYPERRS